MAAQAGQAQLLGDPIGEQPHIEVLLKPMPPKLDMLSAAGYLAVMSKAATLDELQMRLQSHLGVTAGALTGFIDNARDLDGRKTLQENRVVLPGPAARRAGAKVQLSFDINRDVLEAAKWAAAREAGRQRRAEEERQEAERQRLVAQEKAEKQRQDWLFMHMGGAEEQLAHWVAESIGTSRAASDARVAAGEGVEEPSFFLERCEQPQVDAIEALLQRSGAIGFRVFGAFRNDNGVLRERYEWARGRLQGAADGISRHESNTSRILRESGGVELAAALGGYDLSVNELPLWHGTPTTGGAAGICRSGFDINFVGTSTDSGFYGPGFYFSDDSSVSLGYTREGQSVNRKFGRVHLMLLSRVVVGRLREQELIAADDETARMRVTAECLGPGGQFGPASPFHSLRGAGNEYICMSSHQVFPEYVVICGQAGLVPPRLATATGVGS